MCIKRPCKHQSTPIELLSQVICGTLSFAKIEFRSDTASRQAMAGKRRDYFQRCSQIVF
ncbi:hypothetical protein Pan161_01370 [Gimesia algae]|uniref:Uncharacterized protein n=1 Tax=Gimesia algae TaxID=2527971 RepID=A0A517V691_9PLAN|nr:hypothetical protein Pan161_01370 [Gimesia algae]